MARWYKCHLPDAPETFQSERNYLESGQKISDTCCKEIGGPTLVGRQTTWWSHTNSFGNGKSSHLGRHGTRHIYTVTCKQHCNLAAANHAATEKSSKYQHLTDTKIVVPVSIETGGERDIQAIEFIDELGKRITAVTSEPMETQCLFQRISITIQRRNAVFFSENIFWRLVEPFQSFNFSKLN